MKEWEANRPGDYESPYADQLAALYDQIVGRGEFSYSPQADPLYEMYKDRYTAGGQLAMQDAMAGAAALSGGYGNSYAQTVGQQQMGAYMTALADVLPELEARAYERWRDEGTDLYNQFQLTQGLDATGYDRYRDTVGDYYNDLGYAYGKWQDLYGNDYNHISTRWPRGRTTATSPTSRPWTRWPSRIMSGNGHIGNSRTRKRTLAAAAERAAEAVKPTKMTGAQ